MQRFLTVICVALLTFGSVVSAQESDLFPTIPKALFALETPHPDDIRINHMNYLRHDRDATMRLGDRGIEFSLKSCVDCHAVRGPDTSFVTIESDAYFCKACHVSVAVQIDCFQCHNSVPNGETILIGLFGPDDRQALEVYLEGLSE